eukprot:gene17626-19380_t
MAAAPGGKKASEKQVLKVLLQYLKKNNLKATEEALKAESGFDDKELTSISSASASNDTIPDITSILPEYENEGDPHNYEEYYEQLLGFVDKALDMFKPELSLVLYPLFVHLYLELTYKGLQTEAEVFFKKFEPFQEGYRQEDMRKLKSVTKREQLYGSNEIVDSFRSSKYMIRLSRETFALLKKHLQLILTKNHTVSTIFTS